MKEILKQLIVDFHKQKIPVPTPRDISSFRLPGTLRKAFVLIGMRRSGKTWTLFQKIHELLDGGGDLRKILYINFEDDRLLGISLHDMPLILDAYYELYPNMRNEKDVYLFFDEIHEVSGWEKFIRRLLDTEPYKIYLTGSSAKMLSKEIATSLRGRTLVREIFPYSFREYLRHLGEMYGDVLSTKEKSALRHHANNYVVKGGFPEVALVDESMHNEILQGYVETVIYRDIVERYSVSNVTVLRKLLAHCLQNPSSSFSINKMYNTLKSLGYSIGKSSLYDFMGYFEDAYCVFSIPAFHLSANKSALIPRKIYPVDSGLVTAYSIARDFQQGPILENVVFAALRRNEKNICFYVTKKGQEVDFLTLSEKGVQSLYQVSISLKSDETRKREITALEGAMGETGVKQACIITMDEEEQIDVVHGKIYVIPLWKFLFFGDTVRQELLNRDG